MLRKKQMATIQKTFQTNATAIEMKHYIDTKVLPQPALKALLEEVCWQGYTLNISSKLGNGQIILKDNEVEILIHLTLFGSMAKKTLEATLDKEFKQLNSGK